LLHGLPLKEQSYSVIEGTPVGIKTTMNYKLKGSNGTRRQKVKASGNGCTPNALKIPKPTCTGCAAKH